jgi:hypothetical protein
VKFGPKVIIDSGASDHMTGDVTALTDVQPCYISVMMADGFIVNCTQKGTMRFAIPDYERDLYLVIPLLDTLMVPGLQLHLVSVPALNKSGIIAQFDLDCARLAINDRDITIPDPYHRKANKYNAPLAANATREETAADIIPAVSPNAGEPPNMQVSLELMH